ncbi:PQQ-binding-like beta-propeller repeat protein [Haloarchaeobius sp. HRN-SO-5]|uniref:PQQ-like beta-propeller repeat protein n=1 Tax=Haloarchaeobius sp. HRN-SO-5 TaxID=3446118 RepID=UPI003EB952BB
MERLLQLHVLAPEDDDNRLDNILDILSSEGFPVVDDGELPLTDSDVSFSTSLFEERSDNLEQVERVRRELTQLYDEGDIFRHERPLNMEYGRSVKDPSAHIILRVTNLGITKPRIQWRQSFDLLNAPPRSDGVNVYHATPNSVFSLDANSGELTWEQDFERINSVPEVADGMVVAKGGFSVRAYDAMGGEELWEFTTGDNPDQDLIDSRVEIGPESVYVGTRGGDVLALSKVDGSCTVLCSYPEGVVQLAHTGDELLIGTRNPSVHAVETDGTPRWKLDRSFGFGPIRSGIIYTANDNRVEAISLSDGSTEWRKEFTVTKDVRNPRRDTGETTEKQYKASINGPLDIAANRLLVPTLNGVFCVALDTGSITWRFDPRDNQPTSRFRSAHLIDDCTAVALDSDGTIYCVDFETGVQFSTYSFGGETMSLVPIGDSVIAVPGNEIFQLDSFPTSQ